MPIQPRVRRRSFLGAVAAAFGAAPMILRAQRTCDAKQFGVTYDSGVDASESMQTAIDVCSGRGATLVISGRVFISKSIFYRSGMAISGGSGDAGFYALGLPDGRSLLSNDPAAFSLQNVSITGLRFQGRNTPLTKNYALVRFTKTRGLRVSRSVFTQHRSLLVSVRGCTDMLLEDNEFTEWGVIGQTKQGGPAIHVASHEQNRTPSQGISIIGNHLHDGEWVAISIYGQHVKINKNLIERIRESGIYAFGHRRGDIPTDYAADLDVSDNVISHVRAKDISATGIEIASDCAVISANRITDTDGSGIKVIGEGNRTSVTGNTIINSVSRPDIFPSHGQITIQSGDATPGALRDVIVERNTVLDYRSPKLAPYAVAIPAWRGSKRIHHMVVRANDLSQGYALAPLFVAPDIVGADSSIGDP
jgi:Right handed beta helix region